MPFDWLNDFHRGMEKADNYAEKTLAAYKLGIKAGGSIRGVSVCDLRKLLRRRQGTAA